MFSEMKGKVDSEIKCTLRGGLHFESMAWCDCWDWLLLY